jgi:hypothetical protein
MTVHAQASYRIQAHSTAPPGYPSSPSKDIFCDTPFLPSYEARRKAFLEYILRNPAPQNTKPAWFELARLAAGGAPHEGILHSALDFIDLRKDCADFVLHAMLRALYQFSGNLNNAALAPPGLSLSQEILSRIRTSVLNFKYFPNEPGTDSLCTWTENHYILYTSAAYLAGQLYPDALFSNSGETGNQKMEINKPRILRWMDLRFRTGFSEWLSHVYYDEDLAALLSLHDFAADAELRQKAAMLIDLLLLDMALNSFKGVFGSTHGRAYENTKKWASNEGTTDSSKLLFGTGIFSNFDNMSAVAFALSSYRLPAVIEAIAVAMNDPAAKPVENRQRMGIRLEEMERWGIHPDNFEDGMLYLTLEAYLHPRTIQNTLRMFDICNWWENSFLNNFKTYHLLLRFLGALGGLPHLARFLERDICRNTREEVNIYTYKTTDYMLSTAQDYRKGFGGDQQHIWQATLGQDAVCFTTHPAKIEGVTPNYWSGSGLLPRAAQYKNVAVVVYNIEKIPALYVPIRHFFTHAWLPKDKFDQVVEQHGWIFARKGNGFLALRSMQPYAWNTGTGGYSHNPEDVGREIVAGGVRNIWICQLGRKPDDGEFSRFVETIAGAEVIFNGLNVEYHSPGNGCIRFGWESSFSVDSVEIPLRSYPRYENPYCLADFDPPEIRVAAGDKELILNWPQVRRSFST